VPLFFSFRLTGNKKEKKQVYNTASRVTGEKKRKERERESAALFFLLSDRQQKKKKTGLQHSQPRDGRRFAAAARPRHAWQ
jgi:hypothetical protein